MKIYTKLSTCEETSRKELAAELSEVLASERAFILESDKCQLRFIGGPFRLVSSLNRLVGVFYGRITVEKSGTGEYKLVSRIQLWPNFILFALLMTLGDALFKVVRGAAFSPVEAVPTALMFGVGGGLVASIIAYYKFSDLLDDIEQQLSQ